jgi:hypothetical protein
MLKSKKETRLINCLICWTRGGRTNPDHFTCKMAALSAGSARGKSLGESP